MENLRALVKIRESLLNGEFRGFKSALFRYGSILARYPIRSICLTLGKFQNLPVSLIKNSTDTGSINHNICVSTFFIVNDS